MFIVLKINFFFILKEMRIVKIIKLINSKNCYLDNYKHLYTIDVYNYYIRE